MATINDYKFNEMSRIGVDHCSLDEVDIQSVKHGNYMLTNHFSNDSTMSAPIQFALNQPNVFYKGTKQVAYGGSNIDESSELTIGSKLTHDRGNLNLQERSYITVPYLGRGTGNSDIELELKTGECQINKKTVNPSSELSYISYKNYPLLDSIQQSVANPSNRIESEADSSWVRGGLPSRDLIRDNNSDK